MPTRSEAVLRLQGGVRDRAAYVLGLDQATTSGWALVDVASKRCLASGSTRTKQAEAELVCALAEEHGVDFAHVLAVFEAHDHIPASAGIPVSALLKLGQAQGRWLAHLTRAGLPYDQHISVQPAVWRSLLGVSQRMSRKAWKKTARAWARGLTRREVRTDDEAEAIVIALWGVHVGIRRWAQEVAT